jgi:hypothetical protein
MHPLSLASVGFYARLGVIHLTFDGKRLIMLLALMLAACGAKSTTQQTAVTANLSFMGARNLPDPCALLTLDEVISALGTPVKEPIQEQELVDAECTYEAQGERTELSLLVELTATGPNSASFEQRAHFFQTEGAAPITGIGAPAYAHHGAILTQKADIILFVIVTDPTRNDPALLSAARNLTLITLERLP